MLHFINLAPNTNYLLVYLSKLISDCELIVSVHTREQDTSTVCFHFLFLVFLFRRVYSKFVLRAFVLRDSLEIMIQICCISFSESNLFYPLFALY